MIDATKYEQRTPEWTLAKFLELWQERNWDRMLNYCQISWVKFHKEPKKKIVALFRQKLIDAKILEVEKVSEVTRDISIEIRIKDINVFRKIKRKARVICEKGYMKPSVDGTWGVNPLSLMRKR